MLVHRSACVVVAGAYGSGPAGLVEWLAEGLAGTGFQAPPHQFSNAASDINEAFLSAIGRLWCDPEPLPDGCFSGSAAAVAQAEIVALLDRLADAGGDVLLQDGAMARLGPLWLSELKARFEPLVVVQVFSGVDAAFNGLSFDTRQVQAEPSSVICQAHSDLLWLHCTLELERWTRGERRLAITREALTQSPEAAGCGLLTALGQALGRDLPALDPPALATLPATPNPLPSDRDRLLERIHQALCGEAKDENAKRCLEAAWEQLQVRVPAAHQTFDACDDAEVFHQARLQRFVSLCEPPPPFPKSSPVHRFADRISRRVRRRGPRAADAPFLFISGNPAARSHLYRVTNPADGLRRLGAPAGWMSAEALGRHDMDRINARCVILHRCAEDEAIGALIDRCRSLGVPVGYDIDDLIFDAELIRAGGIHFIAQLPELEREAWLGKARGHRRLMAAADFCLTPTRTLTEQVRRVNPQVRTIENGFSAEVLALSDLWRRRRLGRDGPRIGYASGTATHEADFATIVRPLAAVLRRQPNLGFTLVGSLDLAPCSELLPDPQLEMRPLVEHVNLACELARFDINLIPLQSGSPFCDAKSPLKHFEAALVGVPSIAVANPVYEELIRHGKNGLLASSEEEWAANIDLLANDAELRTRLGAQAREECAARFHAHRLAEKYLRLPV